MNSIHNNKEHLAYSFIKTKKLMLFDVFNDTAANF